MSRKREKIDERIPRTPELINPTFLALKSLGGSGKNEEILNEIINQMKIPDEVADIPHKGNPNKTELSYQADWARTYLRNYGAIENSSRAVWSITKDFSSLNEIDGNKIYRKMNAKFESNRSAKEETDPRPEDDDPLNDEIEYPDELKPWKEKLSSILQTMDPFGFERLTQRLLRECGFSEVKVTKKTGDGGIDGTGKLKINGIFSFNVAFQCKRYKGLVGAAEIRDFRGSLTTDIEKGVFLTTGTFTKSAKDEASNPGKQQIDLIDGEELINKIAEYGLGVKPITTYMIDEDFFSKI